MGPFFFQYLSNWSCPMSSLLYPPHPWKLPYFCCVSRLFLLDTVFTIFFSLTVGTTTFNLEVCLVTQSCPTLCNPMDCSSPGSSVHGDSLGKNTGVGCHVLLQGIFPIQGSNPGLPHCRWSLYCLSHQGSPRILEWVAYPFSRGSSQPRDWTQVSHTADGFFTFWTNREAQEYWSG